MLFLVLNSYVASLSIWNSHCHLWIFLYPLHHLILLNLLNIMSSSHPHIVPELKVHPIVLSTCHQSNSYCSAFHSALEFRSFCCHSLFKASCSSDPSLWCRKMAWSKTWRSAQLFSSAHHFFHWSPLDRCMDRFEGGWLPQQFWLDEQSHSSSLICGDHALLWSWVLFLCLLPQRPISVVLAFYYWRFLLRDIQGQPQPRHTFLQLILMSSTNNVETVGKGPFHSCTRSDSVHCSFWPCSSLLIWLFHASSIQVQEGHIRIDSVLIALLWG